MRWMLLLLLPGIAVATDLSGLSGTWSIEREPGSTIVNRVAIVDIANRLYFHYVSDAGHSCEVFGMARRRSDTLYVFRNIPEDRLYEGYEGYGLEENQDCELSFERVGAVLKVRSNGNCKSFCGLNGSIGGDLHRLGE
jgi:hypothetical protein